MAKTENPNSPRLRTTGDANEEAGRQFLLKKLDPKGEVAWKIAGGERLTPEEFAVAKAVGYYTAPGFRYDQLMALYYEDNKRRGYLCRQPAEIPETDPNSTLVSTFCSWGIHAYEVKKELLTPRQIEWFKAAGWTEDQFGTGDHKQQPKNASLGGST